MKTTIGWIIMLVSMMHLGTVSSFAIYLNGTSDPSANTTAPTNNIVGFNAVGLCNGLSMTRTWSNAIVGATSHGVPSVGDIVTYDGEQPYTITNVTCESSPGTPGGVFGALVNRNFPNGSWPKVCTSTNLNGKALQVISHAGMTKGRQIITVLGCPSERLVLSSLMCCGSSNTISVTGGAGTTFVIQARTNLGPWFTITSEKCVPASNCCCITTSQAGSCSGQLIQYQAMVTGITTITNGWERGVPCTTKRWGTNIVEQSLNDDGSARYEMSFSGNGGSSECATGPTDSRSPGFVLNTNTCVYEFSLLVESGDEGPYANAESTGGILWGPMIDQRGLTLLDPYDGYAAYWTNSVDGPPTPSKTQFTCVGSHYQWLKAHKFVP